MRFSYWEHAVFFQNIQDLVIGGGIVGLTTAIELKRSTPNREVVVIERDAFSAGASTKNAGFACFGSSGELLDDLEKMPLDEVFNLVERRYRGLQNLQALLGKVDMEFELCGGIELFRENDAQEMNRCLERLDFLNDHFEQHLGFRPYQRMQQIPRFNGQTKFIGAIENSHEGRIHTGKLIQGLRDLAVSEGVRFIHGLCVNSVESASNACRVVIEGEDFHFDRVFVCTNGFASQLLPDLDVRPTRNQVVVTSPLPAPIPDGTYHVNKGYIYFRPIGNRVLIGGFRDTDLAGESTAEFGLTETIQREISAFINQYITPSGTYTFDYRWSGIMGLGPDKSTIVKKMTDHLFVGVRMGGMGVAIGSLVGKELALLANASK
ncbi:MAG: NAD(P)/FAD-dependent oxidoreductase [Flavobacteriales bacterium]